MEDHYGEELVRIRRNLEVPLIGTLARRCCRMVPLVEIVPVTVLLTPFVTHTPCSDAAVSGVRTAPLVRDK